jgi:hypothetical protein
MLSLDGDRFHHSDSDSGETLEWQEMAFCSMGLCRGNGNWIAASFSSGGF